MTCFQHTLKLLL